MKKLMIVSILSAVALLLFSNCSNDYKPHEALVSAGLLSLENIVKESCDPSYAMDYDISFQTIEDANLLPILTEKSSDEDKNAWKEQKDELNLGDMTSSEWIRYNNPEKYSVYLVTIDIINSPTEKQCEFEHATHRNIMVFNNEITEIRESFRVDN